MKSAIIPVGIIILMCAGMASAQHDSNLPTIPCPANYLYVPARTLLANRTQYVMPEYPPAAIEAKMQGDVAIRVLIDNQGNVKDFEPRKGYVVLAMAATKAISNWKYKPFAVNPGQKGVESLIVLTFSLNGGASVNDGPPELMDMLDTTLRVRKVCFAGGILTGNLIYRVDPDYPAMARAGRVQGEVVIEVTIDKTGNISRATVVKGPTLFADAALAAVKQWKYRPYVQGGNPIEVESTVTVRFHL